MSRPTVEEIAALTARLRELSQAGREADAVEVDQFLADKDRLIERISAASRHADPAPPLRGRENGRIASAADSALLDVAQARAGRRGYALVGPSARTWRTDPDTGRPVEPVSAAEHHAVRQLLGREALTSTEPVWADGPDGPDVVSAIVVAEEDADDLDGFLSGAGGTVSAEQAARELTADGRTLDEARALVGAYLDDVSANVGIRAHEWGLDASDVEEIRAGDTARTEEAVQSAHEVVTATRVPEPAATADYAAAEPVVADEDVLA